MKPLSQNNTIKITLGFIIIALLFIASSLIGKHYENDIRTLTEDNQILGMSVYVTVIMISIIATPVSTLPFIPLASSLWGWVVAGILSIIGWWLGAQIAFLLARHYGKPLVQKLVSLETLEKFEKSIPEEHLFWSVVLLRMVVSVDLLSYALGLFSSMKTTSYALATLIGITPFAFIFAYSGTLSPKYQVGIFIGASAIAVIWFLTRRKTSSQKT